MFKRNDYIIIALICFILGFAAISQYFAGKKVKSLTQPETNEVMAVEIEKVAKNNASLKLQVADLTKDYNDYNNSSRDKIESEKKTQNEIDRLNATIGSKALSGQGVKISINEVLSTANLVDLMDALKNIGAEAISVNDQRININTFISGSNYTYPMTVLALGNSNVLESALNRKGGIVEQITSKNVRIGVEKEDSLVISEGNPIGFNYAKIVN